ncbi:zinc-dependent metalloprotease [Nocardioides insulae]|uniref:zinc-dependent metalloprotease n=1 Tax=Nocardioides insulae TaxID=394734 RepID=UPI00041A3310|nr:zinc-dependent metalloprotease [Nocardioides insulae]
MNDKPGPEDSSDDQNPFKGTPFEAMFGMFGGAPGGAGGPGGQMPDLNQIFGQIQSLMQPYDGPLNWEAAEDLARKTVAQQPDPSPTQREKDAVADAVRLADVWLDGTTSFPSGVRTATAWSRAEWLVNTFEVWKLIITPVAESSVNSVNSESLPEEVRAMAGPMMGFLGKAVGALMANQAGTGLGTLAGEVLSGTAIGVPLTAPGRAALIPANVPAFAEGLGVSEDDVLLFLALREAAHLRLFAAVPWLRDHVIGAVTEHAQGVELDMSNIQERMQDQLRGINPQDPASMQQMLEGDLFAIPESPRQKAAKERLEVVLALVEGWVDELVTQATEERMPSAAKLQEAWRRRRALGGPAEQTFATLVGLEMRPRRLRDAATLWGSLRTRQGIEARDGVWMSPHLLPTAADLDDPLGFREGAEAPDELSEVDFDAELRKLLDGGSGDSDSQE